MLISGVLCVEKHNSHTCTPQPVSHGMFVVLLSFLVLLKIIILLIVFIIIILTLLTMSEKMIRVIITCNATILVVPNTELL